MENNNKRVALYCRASSEDGIKLQEKNLAARISVPYKVYADIDHVSRFRAGYNQLLKDAEKHSFDEIYIAGLSRIERDAEKAYRFLARMQELGIRVTPIAESAIPQDKLIAVLKVAMENENKLPDAEEVQ